jgi:protein-S-isoprenylcysteine O-methyltransferase Ste14
MKTKLMTTTYLLVAILLSIALHFLIPFLYVVPSPWNLIGLIPMIFGVWINISADQAFKKVKTTVKPFEESNTLIQDAVFRLSRNPMYLGFVSVVLGISILLKSLSPYAVVLAFAIFMDLVFIRVEERMLGEKFGEQWEQYRSRVRKWI